MSVSLIKGQKISLDKESGKTLNKVYMGLGWDAVKKSGFLGRLMGGGDIDLDASCVLFSADKQPLDVVYFGQLGPFYFMQLYLENRLLAGKLLGAVILGEGNVYVKLVADVLSDIAVERIVYAFIRYRNNRRRLILIPFRLDFLQFPVPFENVVIHAEIHAFELVLMVFARGT